jgi:phenylacetate-CoA ligase
MENWLKKDLMSFKPDYLYGYPNVIYEMAKLIQKKKIIIPKIKKIICSAQTLEHREFIEKIFNCKVINQYGSREILSIAIEYNNYVMHSSDDFVIVEIGKNNEIILTPLESYGMPLIRYVIGDQGIKKKSKITDTYPFQQFNIQIGRISELLNSHTGEKISSGKINMQIADQKLNIGEFQLIQKSLQDIEIKIVKDTNSNQNDIEKLKSIIRNVLGISDIKITLVEKFPLEKNGKKIGYKNLIENK